MRLCFPNICKSEGKISPPGRRRQGTHTTAPPRRTLGTGSRSSPDDPSGGPRAVRGRLAGAGCRRGAALLAGADRADVPATRVRVRRLQGALGEAQSHLSWCQPAPHPGLLTPSPPTHHFSGFRSSLPSTFRLPPAASGERRPQPPRTCLAPSGLRRRREAHSVAGAGSYRRAAHAKRAVTPVTKRHAHKCYQGLF